MPGRPRPPSPRERSAGHGSEDDPRDEAELRSRFFPLSEIRARYPELREDRVRYLESWGLVHPARVAAGARYYSFEDLTVLADVHRRLETGASLRAIVRTLVAERGGQLSLELGAPRATATVIPFPSPATPGAADEWFLRGYRLEQEPGEEVAAERAYARALEHDPELVPALINLANLRYQRDDPDAALELYRRAEELAGDEFFQIPFNLGNIAHDRGRYEEARRLYERALRLEPAYADAHFYLALTLERLGRSSDARPHWRAYRRLEPAGEWVSLAREMEGPA